MTNIIQRKILTTKAEERRQELHTRICDRYIYLCKIYPTEKPTRIFTAIAEEEDLTMQGVRKILETHNLYKAKYSRRLINQQKRKQS